MSDEISFLRNMATEVEIVEHLRRCDALYVPPLSERIEIGPYGSKIATRAERFEAWSGRALIGLVAAYCNDPELRAVYITSVSVLKDWQGRGVASRLVNQSVAFATEHGFKTVELEVNGGNLPAVRMYTTMGFELKEDEGQTNRMTLSLGKARK
jgi:GNAT superfamily N-acetyltransferase